MRGRRPCPSRLDIGGEEVMCHPAATHQKRAKTMHAVLSHPDDE
jgi:hypothetical protein